MLKEEKAFKRIFSSTTKKLRLFGNPIKRAEFIHKLISNESERLFKDPIISNSISCKKSCSACCHTQVSVTRDEADLLAREINRGAYFNEEHLQILARAGNDSQSFYSLDYKARACPFLDKNNNCSVYQHRPSVCRSNYVLSDPSLCETVSGKEQPIRLLNTFRIDMIIMAFFKHSRENGALPMMVKKSLEAINPKKSGKIVNKA